MKGKYFTCYFYQKSHTHPIQRNTRFSTLPHLLSLYFSFLRPSFLIYHVDGVLFSIVPLFLVTWTIIEDFTRSPGTKFPHASRDTNKNTRARLQFTRSFLSRLVSTTNSRLYWTGREFSIARKSCVIRTKEQCIPACNTHSIHRQQPLA